MPGAFRESGWYWVQQADMRWCVARYTGHGRVGYFQLCGSVEMLVDSDFGERGLRLGPRLEEPAP